MHIHGTCDHIPRDHAAHGHHIRCEVTTYDGHASRDHVARDHYFEGSPLWIQTILDYDQAGVTIEHLLTLPIGDCIAYALNRPPVKPPANC